MTPSFSFNLVDEPWLPCTRSDGTAVTLNLRDVLTQAHQLQSLAGDSPPQTAALHRFLLAILHRIFGPAGYDEWAELWQATQFDASAVNNYLEKWRHRFDLFDAERPFYQSALLYLESQWVSIDRLVHELNAAYPLFNHSEMSVKDFLNPAEASRALIMAQSFSLCGTSGAFFPQTNPREKKRQSMFVDGSIARAVNFLIDGNSLFETLMLNLVQYPDDQIVKHFKDDAPAWEQEDPSSPKRGPLLGYLDYLTWQNRRVLLHPEGDIYGNPIIRQMRWEPAERIESSPLDVMQHHFRNKKEGFQSLYFNEGKSLWRDSAALFSLHQAQSTEQVHLPPATFRWLKELIDEPEIGFQKSQVYRCLALGMSTKPGQATVYFYRHESIPLPLAYFDEPRLVDLLQLSLSRADEISRALRFAIQTILTYLKIPDADEKKKRGDFKPVPRKEADDWVTHTGIEYRYWAALDIPFQAFIVDLAQDTEPALFRWYERLRQAALDAFEQATQYAGSDGRSFKAVVRGRSYLNYRLSQLIPQKEEVT